MEITFPKYPTFDIFADTETFTLLPPLVKPWEESDTSKRNNILRSLTQVPWLLIWTSKAIRKEERKYRIEGDWTEDHCFLDDNNFEPFFDVLRRIYANHHIPVIHFHNASYDLSCIFNIWQRLDPGLIVYFYTKPGTYEFLMGAMESPKYNFKAKFGDTMLYKGKLSVEKMGDELGYPKVQGVPYNIGNLSIKKGCLLYIDTVDGILKTYPIDDYIKYAKRDVEIIRRYSEREQNAKDAVGRIVVDNNELYESYFKKNIWTKTQASHAKSLFNTYLLRHGYNTTLDESFRFLIDRESYQYISLSNCGGFTTYNKKISRYRCGEDEEIRYMDMNSMYPTIMTEGIPWKPLLNKPPEDKPYVTWKLVSIFEVKWNSLMEFNKTQPIPAEKITKEDLDEEKIVKFYVTDEYLQMLKENTLVFRYKEYHTVYQEKTYCIKKFIEDLYRKRVNIKREKEEFESKPPTQETITRLVQLENEDEGVKTILNSIYGKFCEKPHHTQCFYSNVNGFKFQRYAVDNPVYRCILSGAYITYQGRLKVIEKIIQCSKEGWKVLYADTDSVIFACPKSTDHTKVFGTNDGWLGQWKDVGRFTVFVNSGVKKKYFLMNEDKPELFKKAMSGVNKEFVKALEKQLKAGNKQTIEDIIFIFDPANNVILRKMKKNKVRTDLYNQTIIYDSDYTFNGNKEVNGEVIVENGEYRLIKYGEH